MDQSSLVWDFMASLQQQGNGHLLFSQHRNQSLPLWNIIARLEQNEPSQDRPDVREEPAFGPQGPGAHFFGGRGMPRRGQPFRRTPDHTVPFATNFEAGIEAEEPDKSKDKNEDKNKGKDAEQMKDNNDNGEGPSGTSGNSGSDHEGHATRHDQHGTCVGGPRRGGPCGPDGHEGWGAPRRWGGPHHGPNEYRAHYHRGHGGSHRYPFGLHEGGGRGPCGRGGWLDDPGFDFDPAILATSLNQFTNTKSTKDATAKDDGDLTPDADVFDTESAYVVHISLPGAKKEDVGVNWDAEKSELSVAGVIHRPGDEEFLKTLALDERKVGPFERKLRLGTRASPAHIDADDITAKLEDGILRVEVPKLDTGYVEIRKVDIE